MYEELKNKIIDKTKEEFQDFPDFLDGHTFLEYDNGFITQAPVEEQVVVVPQSITMRQARLQLLDDGLLDEVETLVSQDRKWQIEWEYANEVERTSPLIEAIKSSLGLTDEQIDTMFIEASKL